MGIGPDEIADLEGDVGAALKFSQVDDDEVPDLVRVCIALTGGEPQIGPMRRREGKWDGRRVHLRLDLYGTPRGRVVLGHELGHVWAEKFLHREPTEEWCDAFGVALASPRRVVLRAMRLVGHRVSRLAAGLQIEQAAALLRVGEIAGRSVALERRPGVLIPRGAAFPWPPVATVFRDRPAGVHPIRVDGVRWGLMAA